MGDSVTPDGGNLFVRYLAEKRPVIDAYLAAHEPVPMGGDAGSADMRRYAYDPLNQFMEGGGKRTRPALVLLGCEAVGGEAARALSSAAAIEMFQSAALIHDDIADEGELRRGKPCTYKTEGVGVAINVGDLGIVRTFAGILEDERLAPATKLEILGRIARMEQRTVEGQALDLGWARDGRWDVSVGDYLTMARHKTAYYSAATPLAVGAVCGGGNERQVEGLEGFGMLTGLAFQLQDDLLNLVGDPSRQGKDFRTDITEGKRTLAVVYTLDRLTHFTGPERKELIGILSSHETDPQRLERAVAIMEQSGAIEYVRDVADRLTEQAKASLEAVSLEGWARRVLLSMADFFVRRLG